MTTTQREIYCQHCDSFHLLVVNNANLTCGRCHFVVARTNAEGLMYCEGCEDYQTFFEEILKEPLPSDQFNQRYLIGDLVCEECYSILATVREPKPLIVSSGENASGSMQSDSQASPKLNLRPFRRCRGIPIGDGNYTGCAYGDGTVRPFEGPCDCPTCNGSGVEPRENG